MKTEFNVVEVDPLKEETIYVSIYGKRANKQSRNQEMWIQMMHTHTHKYRSDVIILKRLNTKKWLRDILRLLFKNSFSMS